MPERSDASAAWAAPDSGAPSTATSTAAFVPVEGAPSTGVAVARGDARRPARSDDSSHGHVGASDDPAAMLERNPLRGLAVVGAGGVLDGSFDLLRFRFRRSVALAAVLFLPIQLVELAVALSTGTQAATDGTGQLQLLDLGGRGATSWGLLFVVLDSAALFVLGMAAGHLVDGWLAGRDDPFGTVLGAVARRIWVVPIVVVVGAVAKTAAACFGGVGFFLVDALFLVAGPVAGAERTGPFATIGRSVRLAKGAYGQALAVSVGGFAITFVLRFALALGPFVLLASLSLPEQWAVVAGQASSVTLLVTMPLTACIAARTHVDLRCRVEGLDLVRREEARGLRP